ncbi:hypothetical protein G4B88_004281 [Cannabis sativa]|uniref:RNase H type-1 domain-containing protein n=1 Tax=Cannabis sativa TaxID=3483 RepID=A0A7J6EBP5_CANSA|nr:hypothetical protein G4B88_004281 [Cannabis sativa]
MVNEWFGKEDAKAILNIDLPDTKTEDSWLWVGEHNGLFLIKSACRLLKSTSLRSYETNSNRPPSVRFIDLMLTTICIVDIVWNERNRRVHGEKATTLPQILRSIRLKLAEHRMVTTNLVDEILAWAPPPTSWVCCNTDIAVSPNGSMLAAIIRDEFGTIQSITTQEAVYTDSLIAEANAVCMAAKIAVDYGTKRIVFQCDNLGVVKSFATKTHCPVDFRLEAAKKRFELCCSKLDEWEITHISRVCNYTAHNIAKWAAIGEKFGRIEPHQLDCTILDDFQEWDPGPAT